MGTENVAILFTDIVGLSTELSQRLSAEVADEVRRGLSRSCAKPSP